MRKLIFIILTFFIANLFNFSLSAQKIDITKVDEYIKKAQKHWNIPGMAIAIVKDGKIMFAKGYGFREYGKTDEVDDKSLFSIS